MQTYQEWPDLRAQLIDQGATFIYPADRITPHRVTARVYRVIRGGVVQMRELQRSQIAGTSRYGRWRPIYRWTTISSEVPSEAQLIVGAHPIE